jgi:hypothetical protein
MTILYVASALLSLLVLSAHFLRSGNLIVAFAVLAVGALLAVRAEWAARVVTWTLVIGALEWFRTLAVLVEERRVSGMPYTRLAIILGAVGTYALCTAAMARNGRVRVYFARACTQSDRVQT